MYREQDRKKANQKLNRSIAKAPQKIRDRISNSIAFLVKIPGQCIKSLRSTYKKLRKLTFREFLLESWRLYLAILGYIARLPQKFIKWWKKQKVWLRVLSGAFLVAASVGLVASPYLFHEAKLWRASKLHDQAKSLMETEQVKLAYEKSRVAAMLAPDVHENLEQTMNLANKLRHPHTVWWSERVARSKHYDSDSLVNIVEQSMSYGQLGTGARYLSVMRSRFPESTTLADVEIELLLRQELREQALLKAAKLVKEGSDSPLANRVFVELSLRTSDERLKQDARKQLSDGLEQQNDIGLEFCKLAQRLPPEEREKIDLGDRSIRKLILAHPSATRMDRIEANGFASFTGQISEEEAFKAIIAEYDLNNDDEVLNALNTLSRFEIYWGRDQLISETKIYSNPDYALAYLEWLILSEQADLDAATLLLSGEQEHPLPISEANRRFWQAMIANARQQEKEFSVRLLQSVENSATSDWDYMHSILVKHTSTEQQLAFYRELFGRPESPVIAAERYLTLAYALGKDQELKILLKQLQPERFENKPDALNFLLYLHAVQGRNLPETRTRLEKLIGQYPKAALFYRNLAFVYAMSDEFSLARSIDSEIPPPPQNAQPCIRLMHAYVSGDLSNLPTIDQLPTQGEKSLLQSMTIDKPAL
ncbi:hypothetical protein ACFFOV_13720 [Cerasicoccus arenae]|uniref:Uncharacterized protein n=2 Tax=Cerasicoccus arenae TaxID=424488 RepID=A0A8J3GBL6_9BACT|nr:hypothetical protein GCM10007047_03590 [Cerasicoccus arenae]